MPLLAPAPSLITLARRKAAMTRHHGADDERALAASSELRLARLLAEIATLTDEERARLLHEIGALSQDEAAQLLAALAAGAGA